MSFKKKERKENYYFYSPLPLYPSESWLSLFRGR